MNCATFHSFSWQVHFFTFRLTEQHTFTRIFSGSWCRVARIFSTLICGFSFIKSLNVVAIKFVYYDKPLRFSKANKTVTVTGLQNSIKIAKVFKL